MQQYVFSVAWLKPPHPSVVVVNVGASYGRLAPAAQARVRDSVTGAAGRAGLAGLAGPVALVWDVGNDKIAYAGPPEHKAFVTGLGLRRMMALVNKKLVCTF